jgi:hypothetical protein
MTEEIRILSCPNRPLSNNTHMVPIITWGDWVGK